MTGIGLDGIINEVSPPGKPAEVVYIIVV